mmetsp:Transcript_160135/g.513794  ORF Transcript_160135/g.513794 Transcript_160135/m.513794 type:complete len:208 (+) Transcript_160135:14-637(+)
MCGCPNFASWPTGPHCCSTRRHTVAPGDRVRAAGLRWTAGKFHCRPRASQASPAHLPHPTRGWFSSPSAPRPSAAGPRTARPQPARPEIGPAAPRRARAPEILQRRPHTAAKGCEFRPVGTPKPVRFARWPKAKPRSADGPVCLTSSGSAYSGKDLERPSESRTPRDTGNPSSDASGFGAGTWPCFEGSMAGRTTCMWVTKRLSACT